MAEKNRQYEIRYGNKSCFKSFYTDDYLQAERVFDKLIGFANRHKLTWKIALWNNGYLVKSAYNDFVFSL